MSGRHILIAALLLVLSLPVAAANTFIEDFTTQDYMDAAATTLDWDTAAGELRLYPFERSLVGALATPGNPIKLAVAGNLAYLACNAGGVAIVDITDPENPLQVFVFSPGAMTRAVALAGRLLYVAADAKIYVYDVGNPTSPVMVGDVNLPGLCFALCVDGDRLYSANDNGGISVIDITDPATPSLLGTLAMSGNTRDLAIAGNLLYVACHNSGIAIVDVADPAAPVQIGGRPTTSARSLALHGEYLFVADYSAGVQVIDIGNPVNPVIVGSVSPTSVTMDVHALGNHLFIADYTAGLIIADITDPEAPTVLERIDATATCALLAVGNHVYAADYIAGFEVYEFAGTRIPLQIGSALTGSACTNVEVEGDHALLGVNGLFSIYDISDIGSPSLVGTYPGFDTQAVAVSGNTACIAAADSLYILDVTDLVHPSRLGAHVGAGVGADIEVEGTLAFITNDDLLIYDISDPTAPTHLGTFASASGSDTEVVGDRAYVGASTKVHILDISDPANPVQIEDCYFGSYHCTSVEVADGLVFAGVNTRGLYIFDAETGNNLSQVESYPPNDIAVAGNRIFSCTDDIEVIDITDPANPIRQGTANSSLRGQDLCLIGDALICTSDFMAEGFEVYSLLQGDFDSENRSAQSSIICNSANIIAALRLSTQQDDHINWEVSTTNGYIWLPVENQDRWLFAEGWGYSLKWRSEHIVGETGINPACRRLDIKWLLASGEIETIADIPNDQGGQVRLSWLRSGFDMQGSTTPITGYEIYRRIDDRGRRATGGERWPDGEWDFIATVPAHGEETYSVVAPTLADSTIDDGLIESLFFIRSTTTDPYTFYDSAVIAGYSVDNLAPAVPVNFRRETPTLLVWEEADEEDFGFFTIYGSQVDHLDGSEEIIGYSTGIDMEITGHALPYFHLTASDLSGNESGAATVAGATTAPENLPMRYALHQCLPNPFNPTTLISFDLPVASRVSLTVYDAAGRLVLHLIDDELLPAGSQNSIWHGRNRQGAEMSSGLYFCTLETGGFSQTRKMTLVR
ncbi:MAG: T9SS type A sorting domain-containing protein [bacterium]|nr:T9SS type A sorting domain-containing protein [bacterium]